MLTNTEDHTQSLREMKSSFESRACEWLGHTIVTICTHAIPGACRPRRIGNHPYHSTGSVETQRRYKMIGCDTLNPVGYCSSVQRSVHSVWESNLLLDVSAHFFDVTLTSCQIGPGSSRLHAEASGLSDVVFNDTFDPDAVCRN